MSNNSWAEEVYSGKDLQEEKMNDCHSGFILSSLHSLGVQHSVSELYYYTRSHGGSHNKCSVPDPLDRCKTKLIVLDF